MSLPGPPGNPRGSTPLQRSPPPLSQRFTPDPPAPNREPVAIATYLRLVAAVLLWGGTFTAGRVAVQSVGPFSAAFCRFAIASGCLLLLGGRIDGRLPRLTARQWPWVLLLGLTGIFAYNALFLMGLQTVPAGRGALIIALNPVVIALVSAAIFGERLSSLKLAGIVLSFTGAAIVIGQGNPLALLSGQVGRGELYLLGCVASWAAYSLAGKVAMGFLSPVAATTYACLVGAAALLPPALAEGLASQWRGFPPAAWTSIAYLGVLGSAVAFSWYYAGIRAIGPAKASAFINLVPPSAIAIAAVLLKEPVTPSLALGAIVILSGVAATNRG